MRAEQGADLALRAWAQAHARSVGPGQPTDQLPAQEVPWTPDAQIRVTARKTKTIAMGPAISAAPIVLPDGGMLLAVSGFQDPTRIYDGQTGSVRYALDDRPARSGRYTQAAWAVLPDGGVLLSTTGTDGSVFVWNGRDGSLRRTLTGHVRGPQSASWVVLPDGRHRIAVISDNYGSIRVWDGQNGALLYTIADDVDDRQYHRSVAWALLADGGTMLARGDPSGVVQTWDGNDGSVALTLESHSEPVQGLDWAVLRDGGLLLATASDDQTVRIWDSQTGSYLQTLTGFSVLWRVRWAVLPDGRLLLAAGGKGSDPKVCVWNGRTGELLLTLDEQEDVRDIGWAQLPDGTFRLITACADGVHLWDIDVDPPIPSRAPAAARGLGLRAVEWSTAIGVLLACAGAGLWPSLGLVTDLIALTGLDTGSVVLHDPRLGTLAGHPGVQRLRELRWPPTARAAFAVLLASGLTADSRFAPPEVTVSDLHAALAEALAQGATARDPGTVSIKELAAAADAIGSQVISLLTIIGPDAAAGDPLLALQLAHLAGQLPELSRKQLEMISARAGPRRPGARAGSGATVSSPGLAGVSRHGQLAHMLHTQLALPANLLAVRILRDQVLYRRHSGVVPPRPQPVTLVLDVTPPVFGSVEQVLRLVAHLITVALWERGQDPVLVSLARPRVAMPLAGRAQLARMWVSRTLDSPTAALPSALATAASLPYPVVLLAHQHTPMPAFTPGPRQLLITTCHPVEPPLSARSPAHLPLRPHPAETDLTEAVTFALAQHRSAVDA